MKNKTYKLTCMLSMLCLFAVNNAFCYGLQNFWQDVYNDSKQLYKNRPEVKANYYYDFLDKGDAKNKVGASIPVLAWKFITIDPAFVYTPNESKKVGEYGLSFSIRLSQVPIGDDFKLGDLFDADTPEWLKRFHFGPFMSQNLQTGSFGFGFQTGVKF